MSSNVDPFATDKTTGPRRRRLLFVVGNPYIFDSAIAPLIEQLPETIDVTIVAVNFFVPKSLRDRLERWRLDAKVSAYEFLPFYHDLSHRRKGPWRSHVRCVKMLRRLDLRGVNVCVMHQTFTPWDRYVLARLPADCTKVLEASSNHFDRPEVADHFLGGMTALEALAAEAGVPAARPPTATGRVRARLGRLTDRGGLVAGLRRSLWIRWVRFVDQFAAPLVLAGRTFRPTDMDRLTGLDTSTCQAMIVHQTFLAKFLRDLFPRADVHLTESPLAPGTEGLGSGSEGGRCSLLLLLPSLEPRHIASVLADLTRDLCSVRRETAVQTVVLRPHPRSGGDTTASVRAALVDAGFAVEDDGCHPIWETVHRHIGVVGAATSSLLEAAHCRSSGFVVGLVSLSSIWTNNPRYLVGEIEGVDRWVGWIEADGRYDPSIFSGTRHRPTVGPRMSEVVTGLCMESVTLS